MGFRFRDSLRIAPGIRQNLGKRGASLSIGGRGATVNVGKDGVRTTVGIPGTGISYSEHTPYGPAQNGTGQPRKAVPAGLIILGVLTAALIAALIS